MIAIQNKRRSIMRAESPARLTELGPDQFSGYASLFGIADSGGDIVSAGAFTKSLQQRPAAKVRMLYQHLSNEPIGVWDVIREDKAGLFVQGRLTLDVQRSREVMALMRDGAINGLSIGFRTRKASRGPSSGQRLLLEIDLWEISIVTFPLLSASRISAVGAKGTLASSLEQLTQRISLNTPSRSPS